MARGPFLQLLGLALALHLPAQQPANTDPGQPGRESKAAPQEPVYLPRQVFSPHQALAHLKAGNLAWATRLPDPGKPLPPLERPGGAGRYLAGVILCCDADVDPAELFACRRSDLLIVSSPGANVNATVTATLERLASTQRLSLCVIVTHANCPSLTQGVANSPATRALQLRAKLADDLAKTRRCSIEEAQARRQRDHLLGSSRVLRELRDKGRLRIAPASLPLRRKLLRWHTTRAAEAPITPVK